MAGYVIHTPGELSEAQLQRAADLGPTDVTADGSPANLTEQGGLSVVAQDDVTDGFRATCEALRHARRRLEDELRADEGNDFYDEELARKDAMLRGIDEGLLRRSLIVARKP